MFTKNEIRKKMLEKRMSIEAKEHDELSKKIMEKLKKMRKFIEAEVIMGYYPIKNEVNILSLLEEISNSKVVLLPKVEGKEIIPLRVRSLGDLKIGKFGIPIPREEEKYEGKIDLILVPGLAFDLKLRRLGYGFGYYDRFLKLKKEAFKIGLAFDFQIVEEIPSEDSKLDMIITEKRILS